MLAKALGADPFYDTVKSEWASDLQNNPWLKTSDWVGSQSNPFDVENPYADEGFAERTDRFHKYFKSAKDRGYDDARATEYATKAIKSSIKKPKWEDKLMFQLAQSLAGGLTYGVGKGQAEKDLLGDINELGNTYSQGLASQYGTQSKPFNYDSVVSAKAALDQMREQEQLRQGMLPEMVKADPRIRQDFYNKMFGGSGSGASGFYGSPNLGGQQSQDPFGNNVQSIEQKIDTYAQSLISEGVSPNTAYERASQRFKGLLGQEDRATKNIEELSNRTQNIDAMINSAQSYIQGAGDTGGIGGMGAGLQNMASAIFQPQKARSTEMLDTLGSQFMAMNRVAGTGSVSDFEAKQYLRAGVSSANEPEVNQEIIRRMSYLNELDKQKADFLETYKASKGTIEGADSIWRNYVQSNPALVKDQSGNLVENTNRPDWKTWIQSNQSAQNTQRINSSNPLTQAQIKIESAGNPNAVSPKGATGLMQVMPSTARDVLREVGFPDAQNMSDQEIGELLKKPDINIFIGEYYRDVMLPKMIGTNDPQAILQAYNAGPGAYKKYGGNVPYAETQSYVPAVQASMQPNQSNDPLGLRR